MTTFPIAAAWRETVRLTQRDLGIYLTLAATFVLLPMMVVEVFGPGAPKKLSEIPPSLLVVQAVLALIGALAQLSVARLAIVGGNARQALVHAAMVLPRLAIAAVLTSFVLVPAVLVVQAGLRGPQALVLLGLALAVLASTPSLGSLWHCRRWRHSRSVRWRPCALAGWRPRAMRGGCWRSCC